jgi:hypothetical protein
MDGLFIYTDHILISETQVYHIYKKLEPALSRFAYDRPVTPNIYL